MQRGALVVTAGFVALCLTAGVVGANDAPLADAGLDQQVRQGTTVYLDGGESVDPDGEIERYRWRIKAPNGTTAAPTCPACVQTQFRAAQTGVYNVTLRVTDDSGHSRSDTLFVTVLESNPPSVVLTGPTAVAPNGSHTYRAAVSADARELAALRWHHDGATVETQELAAANETRERTLSFESVGEHTVGVTALDIVGRAATANRTVTVSPSVSDGGAYGGVDANSFYEEIESTLVGGDSAYTFKFRGNDDFASNTVSPDAARSDTLGADRGGYGVQRTDLSYLADRTDQIEKIEDGGAETKFRMRGEIADNFESNEDFHEENTRIGVTDKIDKAELAKNVTLDSETTNNNTGDRGVDEEDSSDSSTNPPGSLDSESDYTSDGRPYFYDDLGDALAGGDENTDNESDTPDSTDSIDRDDQSIDDENGYQPTNDDGECVGWGCSG